MSAVVSASIQCAFGVVSSAGLGGMLVDGRGRREAWMWQVTKRDKRFYQNSKESVYKGILADSRVPDQGLTSRRHPQCWNLSFKFIRDIIELKSA
jgi:hypothetical protein